MLSGRKEIRYFLARNGDAPAEIWLESLRDRKTRSVIRARLDRLEQGNPGDHRYVGEGVYELRIHFGPGWRVYYAEEGEQIVVLLCGGDKSSQPKDIDRAQHYWRIYRGIA